MTLPSEYRLWILGFAVVLPSLGVGLLIQGSDVEARKPAPATTVERESGKVIPAIKTQRAALRPVSAPGAVSAARSTASVVRPGVAPGAPSVVPAAVAASSEAVELLARDFTRRGLPVPSRELLEGVAADDFEARARLGELLPPDEGLLIELLDASPKLARIAAERLAEVGTARSLPALEAVLVSNERPLEVRLGAGTAVGRLAKDDDRARLVATLARAGRGDEAVPLANAAILALGDEGPGRVLALAADPARDPGVRAAILGAFAGAPASAKAGLDAALESALQDGAPLVRRTAVTLLSGERAVERLAAVMERDSDAGVREDAALALAELEPTRALPVLRRALETEPNEAVRAVLDESVSRTAGRIQAEAAPGTSSGADANEGR